jgi:hypothetical protein
MFGRQHVTTIVRAAVPGIAVLTNRKMQRTNNSQPFGAVFFGTSASGKRFNQMPRYHFDLIGTKTIADPSGLILADDIQASDAADRLANELYSIRPELRNQHCSILVTDANGEEVCRAPIWDPRYH